MVEAARFPAVANPQLDLVIVVSNETSTEGLRMDFSTALPAMRMVLGELDTMPSMHVGVITPDMGTTTSSGAVAPAIGVLGSGGCAGAGADGRFETEGLNAGATFLVEESGVTNASLPFNDALATLVRHSSGIGCGVQQSFTALRRSLTNPANGAFLRPDANLAVLLVADEDECSVAAPAFLAGPFPSLVDFSCARAGLICDEDIETPGIKTNCRSNPSSTAIEDVGTYVDFLSSLKSDRSQISVASIVGDPSPLTVNVTGGSWSMAGSCDVAAGQLNAFPGVRDAQLAMSFGGVVESVCPLDLTPAARDVGHAIKRLIQDPCVSDNASDNCVATIDGHELPRCPSTGSCYALVEDLRACPDSTDHRRMTLQGDASGMVVLRCEPTSPSP